MHSSDTDRIYRLINCINQLIDGTHRLINGIIWLFVARLLLSICATNLLLASCGTNLIVGQLCQISLASQPASGRAQFNLDPFWHPLRQPRLQPKQEMTLRSKGGPRYLSRGPQPRAPHGMLDRWGWVERGKEHFSQQSSMDVKQTHDKMKYVDGFMVITDRHLLQACAGMLRRWRLKLIKLQVLHPEASLRQDFERVIGIHMKCFIHVC